MAVPKVIVFTCNWSAYRSLESAGIERQSYPAAVYPLRVTCLGQVDPGILLKAFEKGADGVLLLGCAPGECHYEFGNRHAEAVFHEAQSLATLLGYRAEQLRLDWVSAGDEGSFSENVQQFVNGLNGGRP